MDVSYLTCLSAKKRANALELCSFSFVINSNIKYLKVMLRFEDTCHLYLQCQRESQTREKHEVDSMENHVACFMLVSCSSTLKKEVEYSSEMAVEFQRTTR
jgi:hypothetical protein